MRGSNTGVAVSVLCALIFSGLDAHAADGVIVRAKTPAADARRVPASITVIDAQAISDSAARTLPELLSAEAGVSMHDLYGNNAAVTSIGLRGYGVTGPQNTLILVDGQRVSDIDLSGVQWAAIPLTLIERIEILRGTGAVQYGEGASAGVINIVTRSPLKQGHRFEAYGRAAGYGLREGQIYGSLANDSFGINATAYAFAADGYRSNNRNEQQNNTVSLRWALGQGALDLRLGTDRQDLRLPGARRIRASTGLNEWESDPRGAQTPLDYSSRDGVRAALGYVQRLGDAELSIGLDWREKDQRSYFDQGGFPIYRADRLEVGSFSPRLRVPLRTGAAQHSITIGGDWRTWRYRSRRTDRPENIDLPVNRVSVSENNSAFYVQDSIELGRSDRVSAGWREERVRFRADDAYDASSGGFGAAAAAARETQRGRAWELGLRHTFDARWSAFVRAARSFRFVNADEIYENDVFFAPQFQILRPQRSRTREIGLEWRGAQASVRAALFRSDVTDEIHLDPFSSGVGNTNLPPSRRQGLELDARWQPAPGVTLGIAYAHTNARFLQGVLAGSPFAIGTNLDIGGRRVPLVPRNKLRLSFGWEIDARNTLSGAMNAVGSQFMDNDEPNTLGARIPGYAVFDFKLAHRTRWGRVALTLNNAFDRRYYSYGVRSAFTADLYAVYPLPGRSAGVVVEVALP